MTPLAHAEMNYVGKTADPRGGLSGDGAYYGQSENDERIA
jgi:hypothetical protein